MYFLRACNRNQCFCQPSISFWTTGPLLSTWLNPFFFFLVLLDGIAYTPGWVSSALASPVGDKIGV